MTPDKNDIGKKCITKRNTYTTEPDGLTIIAISEAHYLVEGLVGDFHRGTSNFITHGRMGTKPNCWWFPPDDIEILTTKKGDTLFNIDDL